MSRPRDWTAIPGIPSDVVGEYAALKKGRLLTTSITQEEIATIEGDYFRTFQYITVPASSKSYVRFTAPPSTAIFALTRRSIGPNISGLKYNIYDGADDIVTIGAPWDIFSENGRYVKTSATEFINIDTIGALGMFSDAAFVPAGGTGRKSEGSLEGRSGFKIIAPEKVLIIELENLSNANNETLLYYQWVEAPE